MEGFNRVVVSLAYGDTRLQGDGPIVTTHPLLGLVLGVAFQRLDRMFQVVIPRILDQLVDPDLRLDLFLAAST